MHNIRHVNGNTWKIRESINISISDISLVLKRSKGEGRIIKYEYSGSELLFSDEICCICLSQGNK